MTLRPSIGRDVVRESSEDGKRPRRLLPAPKRKRASAEPSEDSGPCFGEGHLTTPRLRFHSGDIAAMIVDSASDRQSDASDQGNSLRSPSLPSAGGEQWADHRAAPVNEIGFDSWKATTVVDPWTPPERVAELSSRELS